MLPANWWSHRSMVELS